MEIHNKLPEDHRENVSDRVWNQLEAKISSNRKKNKIRKIAISLGIAASLLILSLIGTYQIDKGPKDLAYFTSTQATETIKFENLEVADNPVYDVNQLRVLNNTILKKNPEFLKYPL